jgi:hypothetical protein
VAVYKPELKTWIVPLREEKRTLADALQSLLSVGNPAEEVPLMVRLAENPHFHFGGLGFFKGRVTLEQHDCIHILLGRGLTIIDEAFTIGFTMGSTNRVGSTEESLFAFIAGSLYPKPYRFTPEAVQVFKDAVHLGYISDCTPLDTVDMTSLMPLPLGEARAAIHLEPDLLAAYYRIEARRYPKSLASQRLLGDGENA